MSRALAQKYVPPDHMIWMQKHTARLESHWMSFQRLMYLNNLTGLGLKFKLTNLARSAVPAKNHRGRDIPAWMYFVNAAGKPLERFQQQLGLFEKSQAMELNRNWLGWSDTLRYCRPCLDQCFHSILFQFPFVLQCPYHRCELETTCWSCKRELGRGTLTDPFLTRKALHCSYCNALLLIPERPMHQVVSGYPEAEATLRVAHQRLEKLFHASIDCSLQTSIMDRNLPWVWTFCYHSLAIISNSERRTSDWMTTPDPKAVTLERVSVDNDPIAPGGSDHQDLLTILQRLDELTRILRSIQRRLHFRVRAICGHKKIEDLDCGAFDRNSGIPEDYLCMLSRDCPCCACLRWWRAQVSVYFGLRDYLRSSVDQHRLTQNLRGYTDLIPLQPQRMAQMALSMFSYQAQSMSRLMMHLNVHTVAVPHRPEDDDRTKFTWHSGPHPQVWHLKLWLGRLPDASLQLSESDRSFRSYLPIRGAWQALEQSITLHRQYSSQLDHQLQWLVTKHPNPGRWYAAMALNHSRQFWSRMVK